MHDGVIPLFSGDGSRKHKWSAQELAELYRIESALVQAGISVEMETGESDEGEPWFILCSANTGDVLVHVAVIDRTYHIAGGWFPVIRGSSLYHVVHRFMARQPAFLLGAAGDDNVLLHPGSVVIAVLAAICLVSEEYHRETFGFAERNKVLRSDGARADQEIFNVADQRQLALGDFSLSPQQSFVILSAIALSATHLVNGGDGLPETIDLLPDVVDGAAAFERNFEVVATGLWDGAISASGQGIQAGQDSVREIADSEPKQVEAEATQSGAVYLPDIEIVVRSEFVEESPAFTGMEPRPRWETFSAASDRADEAETPLIQVADPIVEPEAGSAKSPRDHVAGLVGRTLDGLGYEVETTEDGLSFSSYSQLPVAVSGADLFISFESLAELAPYISLFEEKYGEADIDMRYGRWLVTNETVLETFWSKTGEPGPCFTYELDDTTPVYFFGISADMIDFSLVA